MTEKEYSDNLSILNTKVLDFIDNAKFREEWKNRLRREWTAFHHRLMLYGDYFYMWEENTDKDGSEHNH